MDMSGTPAIDDVFRFAPVPILVEDWSRARAWVDSLRSQGVRDIDACLDAHLDAHPDAIGATHRLVDCNEALLRLLGVASRDVFFAQAQALLPASLPGNAQVLKAMFDGQLACQGERIFEAPDGRSIPIVWRCALPSDPARYRRLHFYAFDVTEYKESLRCLEAMRTEMARTARISLVGQIAASITHEIAQPLSATRTSVEAAVRWLGRDKPELGEAMASLHDAARWARDTTDICRKHRSFLARTPEQPALHDAAGIVEAAVALVVPEAAAMEVAIETDIETDVPVFADRVQLQQVLGNLLVNGIHAMGETGQGQSRPRTVSVRVCRHAQESVLFEIADTGHGIDANAAESLFQPFSTSRTGGMGIGLSISRWIVEAHGGQIWMDESGPAGTTFRFTIPSAARLP